MLLWRFSSAAVCKMREIDGCLAFAFRLLRVFWILVNGEQMYFAMVCLWETGLHHCIRGKTVRKVSPLSRYISSPKMELFNTRTVGCKCGVVLLSLLPIAVCLVHVAAHTFWPHTCRCEIMSSIHQLPKHVHWDSRHFGLPPRDIKSTPIGVILKLRILFF